METFVVSHGLSVRSVPYIFLQRFNFCGDQSDLHDIHQQSHRSVPTCQGSYRTVGKISLKAHSKSEYRIDTTTKTQVHCAASC
jgi:hypothetical protein